MMKKAADNWLKSQPQRRRPTTSTVNVAATSPKITQSLASIPTSPESSMSSGSSRSRDA